MKARPGGALALALAFACASAAAQDAGGKPFAAEVRNEPGQARRLWLRLALLLRLRWVGVLAGRVRASLAVTGGVHTAGGVGKAGMAGAHATQMVSAG